MLSRGASRSRPPAITQLLYAADPSVRVLPLGQFTLWLRAARLAAFRRVPAFFAGAEDAVINDRTFIVIAAYNEAWTIREVVERLLVQFRNVVVVDDASVDGTGERLIGLNAVLLRHVVNRGQGASLQTGIDYALARGAGVIVTFDADGQHDEKDVPALVDPILRGECDVCLGSRFLGAAPNITWARRITLKAGVLFTRLVSGIKLTDVHNGLRALSRPAATSIRITTDRMAHASEIVDQAVEKRLRVKEVPVTIRYSPRSFAKGQSSLDAFKIALEIFYKKLVE